MKLQPSRALVSVSDKRGVVDFCRALREHGVEILSTGGTARLLGEHRLEVTAVAAHTGAAEIFGGRVKTLHPKIHGGILARRGVDDAAMREHDIAPIDLVAVNLYPFAQIVAAPSCTLTDAIENIDIGGPALLRAAAKNHRDTIVLANPDDYAALLDQLTQGGVDASMRFALACRAFEHTARYDGAIAEYLGGVCGGDGESDSESDGGSKSKIETVDKHGKESNDSKDNQTKPTAPHRALFPRTLNRQWVKQQSMRYGENPHQHAALYRDIDVDVNVDANDTVNVNDDDDNDNDNVAAGIVNAQQLQGKALSYNNIADADAALQCVAQFAECACVIVKHANPCGVATRAVQADAYRRAFAGDEESAFGGVIAFNRELDFAACDALLRAQFAEVVVAPAISKRAREALADKPNIRALIACAAPDDQLQYKKVGGGLLVQQGDAPLHHSLRTVTDCAPSESQQRDLLFAWQVAKFVKSNAIVYANELATVGIGAGQMSRVNSARIAADKANDAKLTVRGAVMASDAFLPFRDALDRAAQAGVCAVIQPGGAMRDDEVIRAANEHGIAMVFTAMRHFRH